MRDGSFVTDTYTFEDVVAALNAVTPYDWTNFLRTRLDGHGPGAPLDGLTRGGYRLVYTDTPNSFFKDAEKLRKVTDLSFSIGVILDKDGKLSDVHWDGPAFKAGLITGDMVVSVNGLAYDADKLKDAVKGAKSTGVVDLIVKTGDHVHPVRIAYSGGPRYPHLERIADTPARLDEIFAAKK